MNRRYLESICIVLGLVLIGVFFNLKNQDYKYAAGSVSLIDSLFLDSNNKHVVTDFEGKLLSGEKFKLSDHIGKDMIVLNFFITSCLPCRVEMPALEKFYRENKQDNLVLVAVDVGESLARVKSFIKYVKVTFPVIIDLGELAKTLNIIGYPTTVVIGVDGKIQYWRLGIINVSAVLNPLLKRNNELLVSGSAISKEEFLLQQKNANIDKLYLFTAEAKSID